MDESADQDEHMNSDEEVEQGHEQLKCRTRFKIKVSSKSINVYVNVESLEYFWLFLRMTLLFYFLAESRIDDKLSANVREENLEPVMTLRSRRSIHKTVDPELPETPLFGETSMYPFRSLFTQIKSK